jgi:hypothetical protein
MRSTSYMLVFGFHAKTFSETQGQAMLLQESEVRLRMVVCRLLLPWQIADLVERLRIRLISHEW